MQDFIFYKKENYLAFTKTRIGETKLGEKIQAITNEKIWQAELKKSAAQFVLIGIPESIGVKANLGIAGTETVWSSFLSSFFNIQHNDFLNGESVLLLGSFDFSVLLQKAKDKPVEYLREMVASIDKQVFACIQKVVAAGKVPVVIGGGHNNAYGNIKGAALGLAESGKSDKASINVINLDAHTDFRVLEGRHSGNGFSYAFAEGYLGKYAVIGAHENYIPDVIQAEIKRNKQLNVISFEDIFIREKLTFQQAVQKTISFTKNNFTGIELDLDVIENVLSSAVSPSGVTVTEARQFIHRTATQCKVVYLHICEGAAELQNGHTSSATGKLIAYLVSDFVKAKL